MDGVNSPSSNYQKQSEIDSLKDDLNKLNKKIKKQGKFCDRMVIVGIASHVIIPINKITNLYAKLPNKKYLRLEKERNELLDRIKIIQHPVNKIPNNKISK